MTKDSTSINLPSDPAILEKLCNGVEGGAILLSDIADIKDKIKELVNTLNIESGIPKPMINKLIKTCFNDNFVEAKEEAKAFEKLYITVIGE